VITLDYGGWDTHVGLGSVSNGDMKVHLRELARAVAAFFTDLGSAADKVTLVTMSEFGRRVEENGGHGTDHGHGNAMLLLGAGVPGGQCWSPLPTSPDGYRAVVYRRGS